MDTSKDVSIWPTTITRRQKDMERESSCLQKITKLTMEFGRLENYHKTLY